MADKRISQLVERTDIANNDVVPIVASGATTTNKATISSIQTFMQENLDVGVTSVGITLGSAGTDVNVTGSPITTSGNITINIPDASATARGVVTTGTQTFAGYKIFNGTIGVNQDIQLATKGTALNTFITNINATGLTSIGSNGFGFNNSNNIYFSGSNKGGGVLAFSNTGTQTYTLQDASGTLAFTSQLDGYVTLDTAQTITAQKVFNTSGSSDSVIITHGSGSGIALDVIKAGNGEAIRVNKTSGTGNAMTISGGNFEAGTIVKTGGTSSQFLKADGSVDSNTYLTTASASAVYVPYTGANSNLDLGQFDLDADTIRVNGSSPTSGSFLGFKHATTVTTGQTDYTSMYTFGTNIIGFKSVSGATNKDFSFDMSTITSNVAGGRVYSMPDASGTLALTSDLGAYLPLTGGTLTGALNGTSASFTAAGQAASFASNSNDVWTRYVPQSGNTWRIQATTGSIFGIYNETSASFPLTLASTGAATFSSSVTAASGTFNGLLSVAAFTANDLSASPQISLTRTAGQFTGIAIRGSVAADRALFSVANDDALYIGRNPGGGGAWTKQVAFLDNGNVGIGTASPATALDVNGTINVRTNGFQFGRITTNNVSGDTGGLNLQYIEAGTFKNGIVLNGVGNVGIGTASPTYKLVVSNGGAQGIEFDTGTIIAGRNYLINYNRSTSAFVDLSIDANNIFFTGNGTERMRITSGGNVGIGTASPGAKLEINESQVAWASIINHTNAVDQFFILFQYNGTGIGNIRGSNTSTAYNTTSDYRLKENVNPVENALSKLSQLKPCNFNFITEPEKEVMGFLAHEVQEVMPQAVHGQKDEVEIKQVEVSPAELDEEGNVITEAVIEEKKVPVYQGIDHSKLVPLLVAAIQEQQKQIDSLKNQMQ